MRRSLLALVALAACVPSPQPPTPDADASGVDASSLDAAPDTPTSACALACANLASLACAEGKSPACTSTCEKANGTLTDLHPACLVNARTKADARKCGSVACP